MSTKKESGLTPYYNIVDFIPPRFHDGKNPYVSFYQTDPATKKLKRKKYMLGKFRKGKERDVAAHRIINNIISKVMSGWNVWVPVKDTRYDTPVTAVIERYKDYISTLFDKKVLKQKTFYDYSSRLRVLEEYMNEMVDVPRISCQINTSFWNDFLDYLIVDRDLSAKTRNNYRTWASAFCTWMEEKGYITENPIQHIRQLPEHDKFRQPLTPEDLKRLGDYLRVNDKPFLLAVMMEYTTAIRPGELSFIKLKDIDIAEGSVFVSSQISKNRRDGKIKLPTMVIKLMVELGTFNHDNECYLFGRGFVPSEKRADPRYFQLAFNKVRNILKFPKHYMFYSLKDSGLRDISNCVGVEVAQKQARHSSIVTTNQYLKGKNMKVYDVLAGFEGYL